MAHQQKGRPKKIWIVVRIDLKKCNLSDDLAKARSKWSNRIRVADPTWLRQERRKKLKPTQEYSIQ